MKDRSGLIPANKLPFSRLAASCCVPRPGASSSLVRDCPVANHVLASPHTACPPARLEGSWCEPCVPDLVCVHREILPGCAWMPSWLGVATRCSSAPLACGSPSSEHSPVSARRPVNVPPWAQRRLLRSAGHTWHGHQFGERRAGGMVGPRAAVSDQRFACKRLGKAPRGDVVARGQQSVGLSLPRQ